MFAEKSRGRYKSSFTHSLHMRLYYCLFGWLLRDPGRLDDDIPGAAPYLWVATCAGSYVKPSPATQRPCFETIGGGRKRESEAFSSKSSVSRTWRSKTTVTYNLSVNTLFGTLWGPAFTLRVTGLGESA